jgi:arylformamidase
MGQSDVIAKAIAATGASMANEALEQSTGLFRAAHAALPPGPPSIDDVDYGRHPRQKMDLYPSAGDHPVPIVVWVHGGGFVRGDKRTAGSPYNMHVGKLAARHGMLGVVMNYRLAPDHPWPAGAEDVGAVVAWLKAHGHEHGGDPSRIFVLGTSAGAAHVASYLQLDPSPTDIAGAVLMSGIYSVGPEANKAYYGDDPGLYAAQTSIDALATTKVPLFVTCAQYDPPHFQAETVEAIRRYLHAQGRLPRVYVAAGHNHFSMAQHLGTEDTRFETEIFDFIRTNGG